MSAEVEVYTPRERAPLPAKVQYAKLLADSGLLPAAYRKNPANVLYAVEYGDMLGLSPMAAITGIHIIEGKPSASAGLISGLVRQAGHKLRVHGDGNSATCQIVRSDDPDHPFEVTWTLRRNPQGNPSAEEAGLLNKGTWKNYPASMLKSRAVSQCARDACEEVLFGLHYTPEEIGADVDGDGNIVGEIVASTPEPAASEPASEPANEPAVDAEPDGSAQEDPWTAHPDAGEWLAASTATASTSADKDELRALFLDAKAQRDAGVIAPADGKRIQDLVTERVRELDTPAVEGTIATPDGDPWQDEIDSMTTKEDALPVLDKLDAQHRGGVLDSRRHKALRAAIRTKADSLPSAPGEAA